VDVTPRPAEELQARRRRNPMAVVLLMAVLVGVGLVVVNGLTNATLYYYNADEAVAKRGALGDDRFRVQGEVLEGVRTTGDEVEFRIAFNGAEVDVRHVGDPPELFRVGIPVVLEGRWDGEHFASDRMLIKHSSEYKAENPDRVAPDEP
jgi:cytochrome c-type biogenesis protein CcmE